MNPLIGELENLISNGLKKHPLPLVKGNSIRIANVVIRHSKQKGFLLFDCKKQIPLGTLNHKASAIGFALKYVKNNGYSKIFDLDDKLLKHNNDCMFYEHTIYSKNASESKKAVAEARYELSKEQADIIIEELYDIVLTSI